MTKGITRKTKQPVEKKKCLRCKNDQPLISAFYSADETLYPDGRFHLCRNCVEEIITDKGMNGLLMILRALNKPFIQEIYKDDYKIYLRQILSLPQYKGMTYDDSKFTNKISSLSDSEPSFEDDDLNQLELYWGKGYSKEDLIYLQNEYEKLINSYECDSYAMELLFQEAAQQRLSIKKLRQESKSVDKELKTLQDLLGSANIKPVQETGANATEQATFGTLIKKYENERPIPEPDPEWKDVDGIKKYIQVWFLGHLCKMIGINNEYAKMYEEELKKHTVDNPTYEEDEDGDFK